MGTLTPGATYIYERVGDKIYAREIGSDPSSRQLMGYDHSESELSQSTKDYVSQHLAGVKKDRLWKDIHEAAKHNLTLADALDRCVEIYNLVKDNGQ